MYLFAPISADVGESNLFATSSNVFSDEQIIQLSHKPLQGLFGIERLFHLEDLSDLGFAVLTGKNGVLSRTTLFRWVKKCRKSFVLRFYDLTRPLSDFIGKKLKISADEHVVARWTRKVKTPGTK